MSEEEITISQKIKSIVVPVLFNILLPTFDVFSDCRLIIIIFTLGDYKCSRNWGGGFIADREYYSCLDDPTRYCTDPTTNHDICDSGSYRWFAVMLMVPFVLNYIASFITWWRLERNKKFSFIFALLNLYAPYGEDLSLMYDVILFINCFRISQDCCDALDKSGGGAEEKESLRKTHWLTRSLLGGCANSYRDDHPAVYSV